MDAAGKLVASIRVGEDFKGNSMIYNPSNVRSFTVNNAGSRVPFKSIVGDDPALNVRLKTPGLHVVSYYSQPSFYTFKSWPKFEEYAIGKGIEPVLALHRERGLPDGGFDEAYARCAKALIQVGDAGGQDRAVGMPLELVAGANPYLDDLQEGLPVQLLWKGAPLAGAQVKVFRRNGSSSKVETALIRTDAQGQARIDVSVKGEYLLNVVHMIVPETVKEAAWESYWASLTLHVDR